MSTDTYMDTEQTLTENIIWAIHTVHIVEITTKFLLLFSIVSLDLAEITPH